MTYSTSENWWIQPEIEEYVDAFHGLEPIYLSDAISVIVFEKYGLWWFSEYVNEVFEDTHGPYKDETVATEATMQLID